MSIPALAITQNVCSCGVRPESAVSYLRQRSRWPTAVGSAEHAVQQHKLSPVSLRDASKV